MGHKLADSVAPLAVVVFVFLLLIQAMPSIAGYRLTADDVAFHQSAMSGWRASWAFVKDTSFGQGRIVHFVDLPFSLIGSYYADHFLFRLFYTALYFVNFLLIGWWASLFLFNRCSRNFIVLVAVVLISFHPLDYFHLAPNAYPFHVSLPVFLILISRIGLWYGRSIRVRQSGARELGLLILFFVGLIFSEYGFLFGLSLVASELVAKLAGVANDSTRCWRLITGCLKHPDLLKDGFALFLFLALYVGFRFYFPSAYDGNRISPELDVGLFAKTLWGHIYGGTSVASFVRYDSLIANQIIELSLTGWILISAVFFSTFYVLTKCLTALVSDLSFELNKKRMYVCGLFGFFVAALITAPVAMTAKYQSWCGDIDACLFLDSRVSFLGVGLAVSALCLWFLGIKASPRSRRVMFISLAISAGGATSYLNNKRIAADMSEYSSAWVRGKQLACMSGDELSAVPISRIVDPKNRVSYHPGFDVELYWRQYLEEQRAYGDCGPILLHSDLFPEVTLGQPMHFQAGADSLAYLLTGWSSPEPWGTWSDATASVMFLPISPRKVESILVDFNALISPSHPSQRVEILVNGSRAHFVTTRASHSTVLVKLPDAAKAGSFSGIKVEFLLPDAARPTDVGLGNDNRRLAVGLLTVTIR